MNNDNQSDVARLRGDNDVLRLRLQAAHAEAEILRTTIRHLADQDATLSVCDGAVTVTMDATLTDEERAAIQWFAHYGLPERYAATLRALLERLK